MSEAAEFPDYLDVDYTDGEGEDAADYPTVNDKIEKAIEVTKTVSKSTRTPR